MTEIDFHVRLPDPQDFAYRVLRRVHATGRQALVVCADSAQQDLLDRMLWEREPGSFLPHVLAGDPNAAHTPVILIRAEEATAEASPEIPHHDVLINLVAVVPPFFSRFARLMELVGTEPPALQAARVRWKHYRDRGYPLTHRDHATPR